ncbi:MAG: RNA methyltransferase, partial [Bacteroidota bacterium]|nr:RNA methyltransferase [Bacteroidota bacterium]
GLYYVQEASSLFLWEMLRQIMGENTANKKVLDVCAAPGGKSTLLSSFFKGGMVVANEVIKSRTNILLENITKWGNENVIVTNNDPAHFQKLDSFFDVILVDAPCSGSGLFRKNKDAISEWSEEAVNLCSLRQQRIVADVYSSLQQGGVFIYSTCSYSQEEDENTLDWMMDAFQLSSIKIELKDEWNIVETISAKQKGYGYRFYPDKLEGEGFFIAAFIKKDGTPFHSYPTISSTGSSKKEGAVWDDWINHSSSLSIIKQKDLFIAMPNLLQQHLYLLQKALYIRSAGIALGKIKGKDVVPHHALAMSLLTASSLPKLAFTKEEAIQFLQRKEIDINTSSLVKGWQLASFCGMNLGWLKVLPNRINNYYPTEWRILKS